MLQPPVFLLGLIESLLFGGQRGRSAALDSTTLLMSREKFCCSAALLVFRMSISFHLSGSFVPSSAHFWRRSRRRIHRFAHIV